MSKLKVSELFYSLQGEGKWMGAPSIFLRTFGCNFSCSGFGMPRGQKSQERYLVQAENFKEYKSLPLVSTGCDSYASWDPRFKHLSPVLTIDAVVDGIMKVLPYSEWRDEHLVITGGEPLLGWQRVFPELLKHKKMFALKHLTFETNGTQSLSKDLTDCLWMLMDAGLDVTFSVSAKLPCSGEKWEEAIRPEIVNDYENNSTETYLKFVIATKEDFVDAQRATAEFRAGGFEGKVYLMPVGGVESVYALNNKNVAQLAMDHGLYYSDRLQVPLFKNAWNT